MCRSCCRPTSCRACGAVDVIDLSAIVSRVEALEARAGNGVVRLEVHLSQETRQFMHHLIRPVLSGLNRLEQKMTEISDYLAAEGASLATLGTVLDNVAGDVSVLLTKAGNAGVFTSAERALADQRTADLAALADKARSLQTEVGDQDGSDAPPAGDGDTGTGDQGDTGTGDTGDQGDAGTGDEGDGSTDAGTGEGDGSESQQA